MSVLVGPVRCRQVDPGQPAGARRLPRHRRRQQDRQGPAHVVVGRAVRPARRAARSSTPPASARFGLAHVTADDVLEAFDEIDEAAVDCPPLCGHTADDPECALDAWAAAGPPARQRAAGRRCGCCSAPSARSAPATKDPSPRRAAAGRGGQRTRAPRPTNRSSSIGSSTASIRTSCPAPGVRPPISSVRTQTPVPTSSRTR